jgi:hypothetical protein
MQSNHKPRKSGRRRVWSTGLMNKVQTAERPQPATTSANLADLKVREIPALDGEHGDEWRPFAFSRRWASASSSIGSQYATVDELQQPRSSDTMSNTCVTGGPNLTRPSTVRVSPRKGKGPWSMSLKRGGSGHGIRNESIEYDVCCLETTRRSRTPSLRYVQRH